VLLHHAETCTGVIIFIRVRLCSNDRIPNVNQTSCVRFHNGLY